MTYRKKLIEVALPLEEINKQSAREKSIRHGHPSTLHLWWARRPLAACRAVLFASLVDDPGEYLSEEKARAERERLFRLIEQLVNWDNVNNEKVLDQARLEIAKSVARDLGVDVPIGDAAVRQFLAEKAPPVLDPFCGGGSIPLEAQRLGLRTYASDLNPVAVLITKALIEIPPKFANHSPVHPIEEGDEQSSLIEREWRGAQGLAEDVRYYGKWMRDEAAKRIGHLYPNVKITADLLNGRPDLQEQGYKRGDELTVIAWIWTRTVTCPSPACGCQMPLVRSFWLSKRTGHQAWIKPIINKNDRIPEINFEIIINESTPSDGSVGRSGAHCLACGTPVPLEYVRSEGQAGYLGEKLMAVVAEGNRRRVYLPPSEGQERIAFASSATWRPDGLLPTKHRNFQTPIYGMPNLGDLFTERQLIALTTFCEFLNRVRKKIINDAKNSGLEDGSLLLPQDSNRIENYADAIVTYLAFAIDKGANYWSSLCTWHSGRDIIVSTFSRQALPMVWDFAEANPFSFSSGNFLSGVSQSSKVLEKIPCTSGGQSTVADATSGATSVEGPLISTDPPYYDNIAYADLSDFFYVWLRKSLGGIFPDLFTTLLTPKSSELIAIPNRFNGDYQKARGFFEEGLKDVFSRIADSSSPAYPVTIFYAYKQSDQVRHGSGASGWETILDGLITTGFQITGTWPVRTEYVTNLKKRFNALATSVVLVCRVRPPDAPLATRRDFLATLKRELPSALQKLQKGSIAPVDFAQASIGPGMAIFSRHSRVLEADGSTMPVSMALALINQTLDEYFAEQEGDLDPDTRWSVSWFEQFGYKEGPFGDAETLSKAKNTSTDGLVNAGILEARAGKVRLLERNELDPNWDPGRDKRLTTWEATQYLILALEKSGETEAAALLRRLGGVGLAARELAYRLYSICERKGWAQEALAYNMLATAWPRLMELGQHEPGLSQDQLL